MAIEFMQSKTIIKTRIAAAAKLTKSRLGSCVQTKIWMGRAVKSLPNPSGLKRGEAAAPTTSSGAVSPMARDSERMTPVAMPAIEPGRTCFQMRSEEHTSELQSRQYLVCRLLLEKKKKDPSTLNA